MRKHLMAAVLIPLGLGLAGVTHAQSSTPAFQNNSSEAQRKAGNNQATAELFYMIQQLQREVRDLRGDVGLFVGRGPLLGDFEPGPAIDDPCSVRAHPCGRPIRVFLNQSAPCYSRPLWALADGLA